MIYHQDEFQHAEKDIDGMIKITTDFWSLRVSTVSYSFHFVLLLTVKLQQDKWFIHDTIQSE